MGLRSDQQEILDQMRWQIEHLKNAEKDLARFNLTGEARQEYEHMLNVLRKEIAIGEESLRNIPYNVRSRLGSQLKQDVSQLSENLHDSSPPSMAEKIYALSVPAALRDSALGDREEIFHKDAARWGVRRAVWLYRWDTSIAVVARLKKVISLPAIMGLGGAVLKWLGAGG